jgi:hypothetical protein
MTCVSVSPMFSPAWVWAASQRTVPASSSTSVVRSPAIRRRRKELKVAITLSGCLCGVVRSPGRSRYSSTRTRSFSITTRYRSGFVTTGSSSTYLPPCQDPALPGGRLRGLLSLGRQRAAVAVVSGAVAPSTCRAARGRSPAIPVTRSADTAPSFGRYASTPPGSSTFGLPAVKSSTAVLVPARQTM